MAALAYAALDHAQPDDGQGAGGARDDHVEVFQLGGQLGQGHDAGAEAFGQRAGALQCAVGDDHPFGMRRPVGGAEFDHLAGADEQHRAVGQPFEELFTQAHAGGRHGHRLGADGRLCAHFLGYRERALKELVQVAAQHLRVLRDTHGGLHLAEDLRFAQHHRVQSAGHAEGVAHGTLVGQQVEVLGQVALGVDAPVAADPFGERRARLVRRVGFTVDFGAVAGGENGGLGRQRLQVTAQVGQGITDRFPGGEGEFFT